MKVILLKDIAKIGKKFDIKEFPNGYASHLIRSGVAELATDKKVENIKKRREAGDAMQANQKSELESAISKVANEGINITAKANNKGSLFEGITTVKLQEAIADSIVELPISAIVLPEPIKEVGEHEIELRNGDKVTNVKLTISPIK